MLEQTNRTANPTLRSPGWEKAYANRIVVIDLVVVTTVTFGAQFLRFGMSNANLSLLDNSSYEFEIPYATVSTVLVLMWMLALSFFSTRDRRVIGSGSNEYKRVIDATIRLFALLAIFAYLLKADVGRGYVLVALPFGLTFLLVGRLVYRRRLQHKRRLGECKYRALVVGEHRKNSHVIDQISRSKSTGFIPVGAVTGEVGDEQVSGCAPVLGDYDQVVEIIDREEIDALIVTSADALTPQQLRYLGWELDDRGIDMVVAASLTDVAGPRVHMRPVAGLPLIHVDFPKFVGRKYLTKRLFDFVSTLILLVAFSPILVLVALLVKFTSRGPVIYRQERIGLHGTPFTMYKFRSMVAHADDQLASLLDLQGTAEEPLHKIGNDPRITGLGRFLRKYSLDELPQLVNVLNGSMSLVGPRPQRDAEVALYGTYDRRRLLVKPGITGLWQVSGRSDLSWGDSIRLDLYYVENWSFAGDLAILWRTARAVLSPSGAY